MNLRSLTLLGSSFLFAASLMAADKSGLDCSDQNRANRACEMREMNMTPTGKLTVDASPNGGIRIIAWEKNSILVRAKVEAWGDNQSEAKDRLNQVMINTSAGTVKSDGPRTSTIFGKGEQKWSVSYEIFAPLKQDLALNSVNGGIGVQNIRGNIRFETVNGGVNLNGVNGTVKGETVNGGVNVDLAGSRWEGEGLQVETVNGGVTLAVPATFNADVHAATVNGGMRSEFDGARIEGKHGPKKMDVKLGAGGPAVRVETVNGGVTVRKKA